jgi:microcystin-dependent protein
MATVTANKTWVSGETVTPAGLNLTAAPTVVVADNEVTTAKILDGNVTLAKLVTAVQQALLPAGAVQAFAMNSAPAGWLAANGNEYAKTGDYAALFAAISTTYGETNGSGGVGTSHFRVPDLRGYFVRGSGINGDLTESGAFGAKQSQDTQPHTHGVTDPGHNHIWNAVNGPGGNNFGSNYVAGITAIVGLTQYSVNSKTTGISIQDSTGTETRPKNIAMLYCIKF